MFSRYHIIKNEEELHQLIRCCIESGYASVDFETNGQPIYMDSFRPTILSVTFKAGFGCSIPLAHFSMPEDHPWVEWLTKFGRRVIENPKVTKIAWNWKFDNQIFHRYHIYHEGTVIDGMLAKYILNEERPNGLKDMVRRYLPDFTDYEKSEGFDKIPWDKKELGPLCEYGCMDTDMTFRLGLFFESKLIKGEYYPLYRNLIMAASRVLQSAEEFGLPLDIELNKRLREKYAKLISDCTEKLMNNPVVYKYNLDMLINKRNQYISKIRGEIEDLSVNPEKNKRSIATREAKISRVLAGEYQTKEEKALVEPINFGSQKQMVGLLFSKEGFNFPVLEYTVNKDTKQQSDNPSTSEATLLKLKEYDKTGFIDTLLELRGHQTINSTFIVGLGDLVQDDKKVHPTFLIHGTTSGRLSSRNPNGQNIPKTMVNPDVKLQFIPPEGHLFFTYDYSQAELRILAHLAGEETMLEWFRTGKDIHLASACKKYHEDYNEILKIYEDEQNPQYKLWKKRRKQAKCFSGDTEILTESGWQRFDQYNGDRVAQYNMGTKAISFVNPLGYGRVRSGSIMEYEDRNISLTMTSNHECLMVTRHGVLVKDEAINLVGKSGYMISAGYHKSDYEDELFTRLLAMIVSDGSIRPNMIRLGFKKKRKIDRCKYLLDEYGLKYSMNFSHEKGVTSFVVRDFNFYKRVSTYVSRDKTLYWKCLTKIDGSIYLDEARLWDGNTNYDFSQERSSFSSSNQQTLDVMQAMGVINGIRVIRYENHISYRPIGRELSRVNLKNLHFIPGNQFMYCVSVPDGNIVIRKDGKPSLQGNCINFGIVYEQSAPKLAESLSTPEEQVSVEEAQEFLDVFFSDFPKVKAFMDRQHKFMEDHGYVRSLFGRRRRCPKVYSESYREYLEALRQSTNMPCQSAASDMALFASVLVYEKVRKGELPPMVEADTVHDSVYQFIQPQYITPDTVFKVWDICRNPSTKEYFGFSIDDVDMSMDFTIGRTMAEELPYVPGYDYKKMLSPDFNLDEYYEEHRKVKEISIKEYPKKFKEYFETSWRQRR